MNKIDQDYIIPKNNPKGIFQIPYDENQIDSMLENINLKSPRKPYTIFCSDEYKPFKNKGSLMNIQFIMKISKEQWYN